MKRMLNRLVANNVVVIMFFSFFGKTAVAQIENYDETYYSPSKNEVVVEQYSAVALYKDTTVKNVPEEVMLELEGTPLKVDVEAKSMSVSYDESDYYDYSYAARIRRFDAPVVGIGYYDDYYTNMYWYTYNPNYWGVSIYLGYNWWYPSWYWYYRPYYYNYCSWGYDPFWNPYWGPSWSHHHHLHHHHHYYGHN
ncbi:MAG: hypothetical protein J6V33_06415, partial [Bacteroidales bacterium]|nr:hypothetical protein [Bacteroidales bacterium]